MSKNFNRVTTAGLIIALGIIYGDIGTSPLYVLNEIITGRAITETPDPRLFVLYHLDAHFTDNRKICDPYAEGR